jgi:hypothetical protein
LQPAARISAYAQPKPLIEVKKILASLRVLAYFSILLPTTFTLGLKVALLRQYLSCGNLRLILIFNHQN